MLLTRSDASAGRDVISESELVNVFRWATTRRGPDVCSRYPALLPLNLRYAPVM